MYNSKIAGKMKQQIDKFSGILSKGLPKTAGKMIKEVIHGIQARQSVKLTEISRALNEHISLKKTEDRICHQLKRENLGDKVRENIQRDGCNRIGEDSLLILDLSDISKKYAKKMEYMTKVHDGSENKIGNGYWLLQIIGAEVDDVKITPLYSHLYSQDAPDHDSENEEILGGVDQIVLQTKKRGIWILDRGGDRKNLIGPLLTRGQRFIIRMVGTRHLWYRGNKVIAKELANSSKMLYAERIIKEEGDEEKVYNIEFGYRKVKLPGYKEQLYMIVVQGFGEHPMMLLTNVEIKQSRKSLLSIVLSYVRRWQIEETIKFVKQSYNLEDIRLLTYKRLQNMTVLVLGAMYFACVWLGGRFKLNILAHHALRAAKRLFGIPDFRFYAIADGIKEIFGSYRGKFRTFIEEPLHQQELLVFDP